jgi:periplasmic protein TonB
MLADAEQHSRISRAIFIKVALVVLFGHLALIFALLLSYPQPHSKSDDETLIRLGATLLVGKTASEDSQSVSKPSSPLVSAAQPGSTPVATRNLRSVEPSSLTRPLPASTTDATVGMKEAQDTLETDSNSAIAQQSDNFISEPDFKAAYLNNPKPLYPRIAVRQQIEGTVILLVRVLPNGLAGEVRVERSSGNKLLDDSAHQTVKTWRFVPAKKEGSAVSAEVRVPIVFSLN